MILIFISGLSSKVKIKVKSDASPQCLQLRQRKEKRDVGCEREQRWTELYYAACRSLKYPWEIENNTIKLWHLTPRPHISVNHNGLTAGSEILLGD